MRTIARPRPNAAVALQERTFRVLTVEDHPFVSDWLASKLADEGIQHVGNLTSPDRLPTEAVDRQAELVVMDISIPGSDAFAAAEDVRRASPGIKVVFLSASLNESHISASLHSGADGYFHKGDDPDEIIRGLRAVASGRAAFGTSVLETCPALKAVADKPLKHLRTFQLPQRTKIDQLTSREREVLRLIGRGLSRAEIADTLHRSPKTIDKHRASLMNKLNIHDRAQLVLFAVREGFVEA